MFAIKAKKRGESVKPDALRKTGEIPGVFYGAGKKTTSISVSKIEFKKIWREAGESSAVKIEILGENKEKENVDVLIHEVQVDPVTDEPIHADFLAIDMKKKIRVKVPVVFEGVSGAVKSGIGNLVKVLHEVEIEALPSVLPHNLVADISKLATLQDQVFVSDLKLPVGVIVINNPSDVVASIIEQVEEKEEVVAPTDLSAIEVEKKGKVAEEGAEGAEIPTTAPAKDEKVEKKTEKK